MLEKNDTDSRLTTLEKDTDRRFTVLEKKVDTNTAITERLATDTSSLLEMWKDASVVFKWIRKTGAGVVWLAQMIAAFAALYGITSFWNKH
jgi:hypothetical protein